MRTIQLADEFSPTPGGRFETDGPFNGELFREKFLIPALAQDDKITIILDGARGYPSSFLDEAFAGLARKLKWGKREFQDHIKLIATGQYEIYIDDIYHYIDLSQK